MLSHLTSLLYKWATLPLSWMGHITVVKMPKTPLLIQSSPYHSVPSHYLQILQRSTSFLIWNKLRPRLPKSTLYTFRFRGGLDVPNFQKYYYAAQLAQIPKYHATAETPLWVTIESVDCDLLSTANLLWLAPTLHRSIINPVTKHSLTIWYRLKTGFGLQSPYNPLLSFLRNPSFYPPWSSPASFPAWSIAGLIRAHQFFMSTGFKTFQTLCESQDTASSELFRFLQVKPFFTPLTPSNPSDSGLT